MTKSITSKKFGVLMADALGRRDKLTGMGAFHFDFTLFATQKTCRGGQMSEWRQKGFVQDSDEEEEESQIESRNAKQDTRPNGRVERVLENVKQQEGQVTLKDTVEQDQNDARSGPGAWDELSDAHEEKSVNYTPTRHASPRRPTPSPFTPTSRISPQREYSESPDPLQSSLYQNQRMRLPAYLRSQPPRIFKPKSPEQVQLELNGAMSSQILGEKITPKGKLSVSGERRSVKASAILGEFGITALSQESDDEPNLGRHSDAESNLSDYPSDLSEVESRPSPSYAIPHRHTAIKVVIPSSTALQHQFAEEDARRHHFRQRKPIQLHPYVLEGERYRREVQSRGLKPVPRERSPQRKQGNDHTVTQEEEFIPFRNLSSSPLDTEIFVSTPVSRKARTFIQPHSPTRKSEPHPSRRRLPASQLHLQEATKRRKLNQSSTQALNTPSLVSESGYVPRDIWSVSPHSPPYSSSPPLNAQLDRVRSIRKPTDLPTPTSSSIFQDKPQSLSDSDSVTVPGSVQRFSGGSRERSKVGCSNESSSDSEKTNSEAGHVDGELQAVSKKIRGVLPASWLRIDRQAQERRHAHARRRARVNVTSPELSELPRGVAKRITRPIGHTLPAESTVAPRGVVIISDDSGSDSEPSNYRQPNNVHDSVQDASALAAMFDSRYANSDDDLASMEYDQLLLPTLRPSGPKRKRQPRITDTFEHTKRTNTVVGGLKRSRATKPTPDLSRRRKHVGSKALRKISPPALSVMDVELPERVPQFLKLARRVARRDIYQARQSPHRKQIRLHTACDTEDANAALRQWQQGLLKPKMKPNAGQQQRDRPPLSYMTNNRQPVPPSNNLEENTKQGDSSDSVPMKLSTKPHKHSTGNHALQMLRRSSTIARKSRPEKVGRASKDLQKMIQHGPPLLRNAQLEDDERNFGSSHRRIAFQNRLQRIDQRCGYQHPFKPPFLNLQLERFLADDDAVLPPQPPANDIGETRDSTSRETILTSCTPQPRKRLIRKGHAQRLDVDAREYRQPSEPAFVSSAAPIMASTESAPIQQHEDTLQGLRPLGMRYPTAFDITPLKSDTYFHSDTFVGSEDFRRALSIGNQDARSLDQHAGYCTISHVTITIRCGPWSDETYSQISEMMALIFSPLSDVRNQGKDETTLVGVLKSLSIVLRTLVCYFNSHLSFSDPIDRKGFTAKMQHFLRSLFDQVSTVSLFAESLPNQARNYIRVLSYLLVVCMQVQQISQHPLVANLDRTELIHTIRDTSRLIVKDITMSIQELYEFHEKNKLHKERENGIQNRDVLVESVVICMHALELHRTPSLGFWDFVSQELSTTISSETQVQTFEHTWATIFSLLPFTEIDLSGIPDRSRILSFERDSWVCIRDILTRVFALYSNTFRQHGPSVNDYIRVNLTRCYMLINTWHWKRPEQILNVVFDFFSKHGLKPLRRETITGSANIWQDFVTASSLTLEPNESSFHIALKCLVTGLQGMKSTYPEKKIRSFVFRLIPNHGRTYPKDQPLEEESLVALRNHHDLLYALYVAAPPSCRPKLDLFQDLVGHQTSHREACRVNVRAWANLTAFQLSTGEPYETTKPFAIWYREIMHQTLKQYRLARTEAEEYLKSGVSDGTVDISAVMVRRTIERNQEQVIATLRDSIIGMKKAIECAKEPIGLATFLVDSEIVHLLELPHLEDHRLLGIIRDTLIVLRQYVSLQRTKTKQKVTQSRTEESQDYGDFPDLDDLDDFVVAQSTQTGPASLLSRLDFIQAPLWHLMSNAFGAERSPDDNLLMDCIDTWVLIAGEQVMAGGKQWSHYMDSFSQVSWQQLRHTEQTRKFGPYFMSAVIDYDPAAYNEHRHEFLTSLLLCLADRESMLRFQHRLLDAIVQTDKDNPLLKNLPFLHIGQGASLNINADSLKTRRLALISSLLSNMREDVYETSLQDSTRTSEVKRTYAAMLKDFMARLKSNYQQLQQGSTATGAYAEFVQKLVQFLKQYTDDICPVLPFFTDSVAFPLPSTDPTYVVGRLRGYAPKAKDHGIAKQLCVFIETVAQQAAADNQQLYLVSQLTKALCIDEAPVADRVILRTTLLQAIFPAYIEEAFSSRTNYFIARPILQCLPAVLDEMFFDLRVSQSSSISTIIQSIVSVAHAFIRGTEQLKGDRLLFQQLNTLSSLIHMFEVAISVSRLIDYIVSRTVITTGPDELSLTTYLDEFGDYVAQVIGRSPEDGFPSYRGDAHSETSNPQFADILAFCRRGLKSGLEKNWSDDEGSIWFGQGRAKKEVVFDMGSKENKKAKLLDTLQRFQDTQRELSYDEPKVLRGIENDIVV